MGLKNIPLAVFRDYLRFKGLNHIRTSGGHEVWSCQSLTRPIVLQTHKDPVPEFIIQNNLRSMGSTRKEFEEWFNPPKKAKEQVGDEPLPTAPDEPKN